MVRATFGSLRGSVIKMHDDDDDTANDDLQVEMVAADVDAGCNIAYDEWRLDVPIQRYLNPPDFVSI